MLSTKLFTNYGTLFVLQTLKRFSHETHYDILKLKRNCTKKDIRRSFIALSKQYHPDKQDGVDANAKFIRILEAYKILSQPNTRAEYDLGLSNETRSYRGKQYHKSPQQEDYVDPVAKAWDDPSFYKNRNKSHDEYYKAESNRWAIITCISFIFLAVSIYGYNLWMIYDMYKLRQYEKTEFKHVTKDSSSNE